MTDKIIIREWITEADGNERGLTGFEVSLELQGKVFTGSSCVYTSFPGRQEALRYKRAEMEALAAHLGIPVEVILIK